MVNAMRKRAILYDVVYDVVYDLVYDVQYVDSLTDLCV